ncbi:MAG: hypothetical protein J1E59_07030 [Treponema sp.]|nr:hypothetical protein [Treponema sp.]
MKRIAFFSFFTIFLALEVFSQDLLGPGNPVQSDRIFARAQHAFNTERYSEAMTLCEEARLTRINEVRWSCSVIGNVLTVTDVKKAGPFISDIMPILEEREEYDAIEIIENQIERHGSDYFGNSLPRLYDYLERRKNYPESDFLLAKIYRLEGEYDFAKQYLERALSCSDILDVPAVKFDILYEMADLDNVLGDDIANEKALLLVVEGDGLYKNTTMRNAIEKSVKLKRSGVDLAEYFLELYRSSSVNSMRAYFELADIYENRGEMKESFLMTAFGVIVGFTHAVEILDDRIEEISFNESEKRSPKYFFAECGRNPDVMAWMQSKGLWRGFFKLATRARENGWDDFANSFLAKLSEFCPDPYWQTAAKLAFEKENQ